MANFRNPGQLTRLRQKELIRQARQQVKTQKQAQPILHERDGARPGEMRVYYDNGKGWRSSKRHPWLIPMYFQLLKREARIKAINMIRHATFWSAVAVGATFGIIWLFS